MDGIKYLALAVCTGLSHMSCQLAYINRERPCPTARDVLFLKNMKVYQTRKLGRFLPRRLMEQAFKD